MFWNVLSPYCFKVAVSWDFLASFISLIQPIWAPDKQVKLVSLKKNFHGHIQIFSSKNSTPPRPTLLGVNIFWQASPLKSLQKMLGYILLVIPKKN